MALEEARHNIATTSMPALAMRSTGAGSMAHAAASAACGLSAGRASWDGGEGAVHRPDFHQITAIIGDVIEVRPALLLCCFASAANSFTSITLFECSSRFSLLRPLTFTGWSAAAGHWPDS